MTNNVSSLINIVISVCISVFISHLMIQKGIYELGNIFAGYLSKMEKTNRKMYLEIHAIKKSLEPLIKKNE